MNLSLSVRIAESFLSKETASVNLETLAEAAAQAGYSGLCMRASQVGVHSRGEQIQQAGAILKKYRLAVSMVTGNFDIVYNNNQGPDCLRHIGPFLDLATALGAPLIRVAMKKQEDIPWAQRAADQARERGLKLAHQCHTESLFESVAGIENTLKEINRPNFGIIFEPANLELCGQDYGTEAIQRLASWIFNVYLQNQRINPHGAITLNTWQRGPVSFDLIPIHQPGGVDFAKVFAGLNQIRYEGPVTVHQAQPKDEPIASAARKTADFLKSLMVL